MHVSDAAAVSRAIDLKGRLRDRLLSYKGVHGLGVGCKFVGGERTDELAILIYLYKKRPKSELSPEEIIPAEIEGIKTDVREADLGYFCEDTTRYRPLVGGSQIGWTKVEHPTPNSTTRQTFNGTLGCLARSRSRNKTLALTAAHVVTACEEPNIPISAKRRIGQPNDDDDYSCCSKCWATVFGTVVDASKDPDSALIEIDKCVDSLPKIQDLGAVKGVLTTAEIDAMNNTPVKVRGYKTGEVRNGFVVDVHHDDFLPCSEGGITATWTYHQGIVVHPDPPSSQFGQKGDSGSAVLDGNNKLVGLFFANQMINGVSTPVLARIDRILSTYQAAWDLEILTASSMAMTASADTTPVAEPHALAGMEPEGAAAQNFQPTQEDLQTLLQARDEILATPLGHHLNRTIWRHVPEIRELIHTQKRMAAVWERVSGTSLVCGVIEGLRAPDRPLAEFIQGMPLRERIAAFNRVLSRYGSAALGADLKAVYAIAAEMAGRPYSEIVEWARNTTALGPEAV
jgi:hypothetical protein